MQINKEFLRSLEPCASRYENYLEHHAEFNGSFIEFLDLPNLEYADKIWVTKNVLTKHQAINWSILCVESVVHIFEAKYPDDRYISNCIRYLKTVKDFNSLTDAQVLEIERHEAIYRTASNTPIHYYNTHAVRATSDAAYYAIRAACAVRTSEAVSYATLAAFHATEATFADEDAFYASNAARSAKQKQKELNIQFLKQVTSV